MLVLSDPHRLVVDLKGKAPGEVTSLAAPKPDAAAPPPDGAQAAPRSTAPVAVAPAPTAPAALRPRRLRPSRRAPRGRAARAECAPGGRAARSRRACLAPHRARTRSSARASCGDRSRTRRQGSRSPRPGAHREGRGAERLEASRLAPAPRRNRGVSHAPRRPLPLARAAHRARQLRKSADLFVSIHANASSNTAPPRRRGLLPQQHRQSRHAAPGRDGEQPPLGPARPQARRRDPGPVVHPERPASRRTRSRSRSSSPSSSRAPSCPAWAATGTASRIWCEGRPVLRPGRRVHALRARRGFLPDQLRRGAPARPSAKYQRALADGMYEGVRRYLSQAQARQDPVSSSASRRRRRSTVL